MTIDRSHASYGHGGSGEPEGQTLAVPPADGLLHFVGAAAGVLLFLCFFPCFLCFFDVLAPESPAGALPPAASCAKLADAIPTDNSTANATVSSLFMRITSLPTSGPYSTALAASKESPLKTPKNATTSFLDVDVAVLASSAYHSAHGRRA